MTRDPFYSAEALEAALAKVERICADVSYDQEAKTYVIPCKFINH